MRILKASEILLRLETQLGDICPKKTQVYNWHKKFSEGREQFENEPHSWHPHTSNTHENIKAIQCIIESDQRVTIFETASETGISYGSTIKPSSLIS